MTYEVIFTSQFKKDLKLAKKQNKDLDKLFEVIYILANGKKLEKNIKTTNLVETTKELVSVTWNQIGFLYMKFVMMY